MAEGIGRLMGKVALVTGAASGIGREAALAFGREGASVVVSDVDEAGALGTLRAIGQEGGVGTVIPCDVTDRDAVAALVTGAVNAYGRIDCAFNNAGIAGPVAEPLEYEDEAFDRVIAVNLRGVWLCLKAEVRQMLAQGGGAIVNASSVAGLLGAPTLAGYDAAKHGVLGLTRSFAVAYARRNVRVNAVCPGFIRTPMLDQIFGTNVAEAEQRLGRRTPAGRVGEPTEVAETVVWLCSDAASYVTGQALAVDGGLVIQ